MLFSCTVDGFRCTKACMLETGEEVVLKTGEEAVLHSGEKRKFFVVSDLPMNPEEMNSWGVRT